ncbi:hypothetical protein [Pontiella sp.]|uniref:hypothetical protein n=1 Tax=Pontiella sp. TaxID=2837462 RepID=UPI0035661E26
MSTFSSILFWLGIVLMIDGACGLFFQEKWQKLASGLDIRRIAFVELGLSVALLTAHYALS